jgi:hypothetical protein
MVTKKEQLLNELTSIPEDIDEVRESSRAIQLAKNRESGAKSYFYEDKEEMWLDLKNKFILGKKVKLGNDTYVYKDYTVREFCEEYSTDEIKLDPLRMGKIIKRFKWREYRKAYLEKLSQEDLELGLARGVDNTESEVEALTNAKKLGSVLNTYLDFRFGEIIERDEGITLENLDTLTTNTQTLLTQVNPNTGVPLFLTELEKALTVSSKIYELQRKIIDNNRIDKEVEEKAKATIRAKLEDKPLLTDSERSNKLQKLKDKLSIITDAEVI